MRPRMSGLNNKPEFFDVIAAAATAPAFFGKVKATAWLLILWFLVL
jgi:hypothetical protein